MLIFRRHNNNKNFEQKWSNFEWKISQKRISASRKYAIHYLIFLKINLPYTIEGRLNLTKTKNIPKIIQYRFIILYFSFCRI